MRDRRAFFFFRLGAHSAGSESASGAGAPVETILSAPDGCGGARIVASAGAEMRKTERVVQDGSASFDRTIADECGNGSETGATDRRTGGGAAAPGR